MNRTRAFLRDELGLPAGDAFDLPTSVKRFEDGGQYRVEIPSVEGPAALQAVVNEAARRGVQVHGVSQGNGVMLQTDVVIHTGVVVSTHGRPDVALWLAARRAGDAPGAEASRRSAN